jgi:hypothetical protein
MRFPGVAIGALAASTLALSGCLPVDAVPAAELSQLTVAPESHSDSYERSAFGQRWKDVDRNGCGQRDDVLARDLVGAQKRNSCVVVAGTLTDPYTGERVQFAKARADDVQIDHRVSLADAWRSGAWQWTEDERERFANDLANLIATAGDVNQSKSDHDAATWLPVGAARRCEFARDVVAVKAAYRLAVDQAEASALSRALSGCPATATPTSATPTPATP